VLIRAVAASNLPPPEDAARLLAAQPSAANGATPRNPEADAPERPGPRTSDANGEAPRKNPPPPPQAPPKKYRGPETFDALLRELEGRREVDVQIDMENYLRVASYEPGFISFAMESNAPRDLVNRMRNVLSDLGFGEWRLERIPVARTETVAERKRRERVQELEDAANHPFVKEALAAFPGAKIVAVRAAPEPGELDGFAPAPDDPDDLADNVIPIQAARRRGSAKE
jgi:DNA polymerase III subunit gamma/tau